jgi:hypothetical protein
MTDRYELDFDRWLLLVDAHLKRMIGVGVYDLPDYQFRDAYEDDAQAMEIADELAARFESGDI